MSNTEQIFWNNVNKKGEDDCWNWNALNVDHDGYGKICYNHQYIRAYKFSYILHNGDVSKKAKIEHSCNNKLCVNPKHLYITSSDERNRHNFWKNVDIKNDNDCWNWKGTINNGNYGIMYYDNKNTVVNKVSYILHNGDIPKNMKIKCRCNNKLCVNPKHLYVINSDDTHQIFWNNVDKMSNDGCWLWKGTKSSGGYGTLHYNNKRLLAHRMSYIIHYGQIPENKLICHKCDTPDCVNPKHLYAGTSSDNGNDQKYKNRINGKNGKLNKIYCALLINKLVRENNEILLAKLDIQLINGEVYPYPFINVIKLHEYSYAEICSYKLSIH
jgi:hypothetical protein